jgi:NCS1 family nucleobase:cation symporter-1
MRAVVVTIVSLVPCIPSFGATIAPDRLGLSLQAQRMFHLSFVMTYAIAAALYAGSYMIWPEKGLIRPERALRFEEMADEFDADEARMLSTVEEEEGKLDEEYEGKDKNDLPVVSVLEVK